MGKVNKLDQDDSEKAPSKCVSFMKSQDSYARPITLTFNRKGSHQTVPGGICSFLTTFLIVAYFALKIQAFAELGAVHKQDTIFYNDIVRNQTSNGTVTPSDTTSDFYTVSTKNITIAYKIGTTNPDL
jgi:hypothetical protein